MSENPKCKKLLCTLISRVFSEKEELIDESENINEPMETEDTSQPGSSQNGEVEEAVKYPFCINRINSIASAVIGPLPDNDKLIDFNEGMLLFTLTSL